MSKLFTIYFAFSSLFNSEYLSALHEIKNSTPITKITDRDLSVMVLVTILYKPVVVGI